MSERGSLWRATLGQTRRLTPEVVEHRSAGRLAPSAGLAVG